MTRVGGALRTKATPQPMSLSPPRLNASPPHQPPVAGVSSRAIALAAADSAAHPVAVANPLIWMSCGATLTVSSLVCLASNAAAAMAQGAAAKCPPQI